MLHGTKIFTIPKFSVFNLVPAKCALLNGGSENCTLVDPKKSRLGMTSFGYSKSRG